MSCGDKSEWLDKPISLPATPMEILVLQWKVSTYSDGNTKSLRWKITPHRKQLLSGGMEWSPSTREDAIHHTLSLFFEAIWWASV